MNVVLRLVVCAVQQVVGSDQEFRDLLEQYITSEFTVKSFCMKMRVSDFSLPVSQRFIQRCHQLQSRQLIL
jgi:hypothetical protein